jgi:hypothetical protein
MSLLKKIRNFFVGMPAPEVIDDTAMDIPKPKPKPKPKPDAAGRGPHRLPQASGEKTLG